MLYTNIQTERKNMKKISVKIGVLFSWTTANWITIFGGILAILGIYLFWINKDRIAISVLTLSFLTDWFDGALGRHQQSDRPHMTREEESRLSILQQINYRGVTHLGRALDPLVDKVRFIGLLWVLGDHIVPRWIMLTITLLAIILILVRPIKRFLQLDPAGANRYGKFKVYSEVISIIILVFTTRPIYGSEFLLVEFRPVYLTLTGSILTSLLLACYSLYGHITSGFKYQKTKKSEQPSPTNEL
jgi:phosphatidylglycerophosphate synthase